MSPSDLAAWFAALSATAGLIWTGVSQIRQRSERAQSEGAEQAGRLLALMNEIGVNGSDPILDDNQKAERHRDQLQDLQRLIRLGSADFIARSLKPPVTKLIIWITLAYSLFLLVAGVFLLVAAGDARGSEHLGNLVGGWTYVAIGLAGAMVFGGMIDRRRAYLRQVDAAGVESTEKVLARYKQRQP